MRIPAALRTLIPAHMLVCMILGVLLVSPSNRYVKPAHSTYLSSSSYIQISSVRPLSMLHGPAPTLTSHVICDDCGFDPRRLPFEYWKDGRCNIPSLQVSRFRRCPSDLDWTGTLWHPCNMFTHHGSRLFHSVTLHVDLENLLCGAAARWI